MEKFKLYVTQRVVLGVLFAIIALWAISFLIGFLGKPAPSTSPQLATHAAGEGNAAGKTADSHAPKVEPSVHENSPAVATAGKTEGHAAPPAGSHETPATAVPSSGHGAKPAPGSWNSPVDIASKVQGARGVAFVTAAIKPLAYELNTRFWGWRPNDILDVTDNVNNYQLGVLEVTRRTVVVLAERISRKGGNDEFNKHVENAMNWLMIKPDSYWFPSPESKYDDALDELRAYMESLKQGKASFYTRPDNLIPLLQVFEDLMGSCEENLVKAHEKNGDTVSHFRADDYFFYAKGVADAMGTILEAVTEDFTQTVDPRRGSELLETIITECHHAKAINPLYITNADPSGFLANHRANLAARISGARYALGLLINTLST
ncbi:MAG: DUF2333 family protein [Pseudomonadota bacterium]